MKAEILALATKQMREGGYDTLNFRGIAEQLHISKANIHHHFVNKETLAVEVIHSYTTVMLEGMQQLAQKFDWDLDGFMHELEGFFWSVCRESGHCSVCVCEQVARVSDVPAAMKEMSETFSVQFFELVRGVVEKSSEKGQLRSDLDTDQVTQQIIMMMSGLGSMARMKPSVSEAEKALAGTLQSWIKTLMA